MFYFPGWSKGKFVSIHKHVIFFIACNNGAWRATSQCNSQRQKRSGAKLFHKSSFKQSVLRFSFQKVSFKRNSTWHTYSIALIFSMVQSFHTTFSFGRKIKKERKKKICGCVGAVVTLLVMIGELASETWQNSYYCPFGFCSVVRVPPLLWPVSVRSSVTGQCGNVHLEPGHARSRAPRSRSPVRQALARARPTHFTAHVRTKAACAFSHGGVPA